MAFEFNPHKSTDDKGIGKIHLDGDAAKQQDAAAAKKKKFIIIGAGGAAVVLALGGIFALSSGKKSESTPPPAPTTYTQAPAPAPAAPYQAPQQTAQVSSQSVSIQQKESAIYRDDASAYRDDNGVRAEAYLSSSGREVSAGQDFAVHVELFNKGGVSVLVAAGPYAGSRVEFLPVLGGQRVTFSHVGDEQGGIFRALPVSQRGVSTAPMAYPATQGSGVTIPSGAATFQKIVPADGKSVTAFTLKGSPQDDGVFSVKIWNGDTYSFDLKTGNYTVDSVFLNRPNYQQDYRATGVKVSRSSFPVVKGVLDVNPAPAAKPGRAPGL
jgi:hypothetical protein